MQEISTDIFDEIENKIFTIRGVPVMLDRDLAVLYKTDTRTIKQGVKRNIEKFPSDFIFELEENDIQVLVSQLVIPSKSYLGGVIPYAFTEQGVAMLASIIKTNIAVATIIKIIRAFVVLRKIHLNSAGLYQRMEIVEKNKWRQMGISTKSFPHSKKPTESPLKASSSTGKFLMLTNL